MGKSEGNILTISELEKQGFEPLAFRYLCHTAHYRMPLNFTAEALKAAQNGLKGLRELGLNALDWEQKSDDADWIQRAKADFKAAIEDDLNMPQALAVVWNLVREGNKRQDKRAWETLKDFDRVLGLGLKYGTEVEVPGEVMELAEKRELARKAKDWTRADELRKEILKRGWIIEDTKDGPRLKRA